MPDKPNLKKTPKPNRHQVSRACVSCRTYRIKCDTAYPCNNCKLKGRECTDEKGKDEVRTFPSAIKYVSTIARISMINQTREIDRLKERVKELEGQLNSMSIKSTQDKEDEHITPVKPEKFLPVEMDPFAEHGGNKGYYNWDYIAAHTASSNDQQTYGPSSSFYFIGQMTKYLDKTFRKQQVDIHLPLASRWLSGPVSTDRTEPVLHFEQNEGIARYQLLRTQEKHLLNLYWESYHRIYPVLDKSKFEAHYLSLWETTESYRRPSAIADIVLAISMQYAAVLPPPSRTTPLAESIYSNGTEIAGQWYYRSCQSLLLEQLERPSYTTVQCHFLSVLWLYNGSFQNMAHSMLATGIRVAIILGLHLEPLPEIPAQHRDFRKRLWWTIYAGEMMMAMELGRPLAVNISQVTTSIPDDNWQASKVEPAEGNALLLLCNTQFVKLVLATRAVYVSFYKACAAVLKPNGKNFYDDPRTLESCAQALELKLKYLETWLQQVPETLKIIRKSPGVPYSTDRSLLDFKPVTALWIPRQSVFLELLYHTLSMNMFRPFITFSRTPEARSPLTERHAITCVNHAITITNIIYQVITETEHLDGWHKTFQWQWNVTLSLIGYILAYPMGPSSSVARQTLGIAITIFEILSSRFPSAVSAANMARDLSNKAELLMAKSQSPSYLSDFDHRLNGPPNDLALDMSPPDATQSQDPAYDLLELSDSTFLTGLADEGANLFHNTYSSSSAFAFPLEELSELGNVDFGSDDPFDFLDFSDGVHQ
jgi:hypothetical protein